MPHRFLGEMLSRMRVSEAVGPAVVFIKMDDALVNFHETIHQALHALKSQGINVRTADLAFLSPYATSKLKRFGDYPTDLHPEAMPTCTTLPL